MKKKFTKHLTIIILVSLIYTLKAQTNKNSTSQNIKTTSPNATSLQTNKVQGQGSKLTISIGHNGAVIHLVISPDSAYLLSGGLDGCIKIWDIEAGALVNKISGLSINQKNFDITPDGKYVVAISNTYRLVIIDIHSAKVVKAFSYTNDVNYLKIIDNGTKIICGSERYSTKIYDLKSGKQIAEVSIAPGVNDYTKTENTSLVLTKGMYYQTYSTLVDFKKIK